MLLVNEKGDMAVAKWHTTPAPFGSTVKWGYWQLTGCALDFPNPTAWAECPKGPNHAYPVIAHSRRLKLCAI